MDCKEAREALEPFVDDELEAARSFAVDRHVAACRRCRTEVDEIQALDERIRAAFRARPTAEMRARVRARLERALDPHISTFRSRRPQPPSTLPSAVVGSGFAIRREGVRLMSGQPENAIGIESTPPDARLSP